ncbi:MAG: hypothetical protein FJW86_01480 [Actinobacteria bacterium]|nr:hypothetical protein [Actinomycetota bacterium]
MRRFLPMFGAALAGVLIVGGAVALAVSDGAAAFKVDGHSVSQSTIDDELGILADHPDFAAGLVGTEVVSGTGSLPADVSASWVTIRVVTTYAKDELKRLGERVTDADRTSTGLQDFAAFQGLPADLRADVLDDLASLGALQRVIAEDPDSGVADAALAACPSQRFVAHILVETEAEAVAAAGELAAGAEFAAVAQERSTDPGSAALGGQLGCLDELGDAVAPFLAAVDAATIDVVTDPVQTEFGFHLILVTDTPSAGDLDAASIATVLEDLGKLRVDVDPRYGRWDAARAQVVPRTPASSG